MRPNFDRSNQVSTEATCLTNPSAFDWFSLLPLIASVFGLVKSLPPIFYEVVRLIPNIMAPNERVGVVIRKQSEIITDICRG